MNPMSDRGEATLATRILGLLDLTNLEPNCGPADVKALCAKAASPIGHTAAVCIWPQFAAEASQALRDTGVKVATVINFPAGGEDHERALEDAGEALQDHADEIDLVMPYQAFLRGDEQLAADMIRDCKEVVGAQRVLKVILETGAFPDQASISRASHLAITSGADFIKTSTGKIAISATLAAAETMLEAIRATGGTAGFKAAGGIRTIADAAGYLAVAERIMGPGWVTPRTFRFGASSLHGALVAALGGEAPATSAKPGY
jgi:deoxyribose-phosphate aldolase